MIERIIKFSTQPGDSIIDCFSGTGTVLRAVANITQPGSITGKPTTLRYVPSRNPVTSIELDANYCDKIAGEHGLDVEQWRAAA